MNWISHTESVVFIVRIFMTRSTGTVGVTGIHSITIHGIIHHGTILHGHGDGIHLITHGDGDIAGTIVHTIPGDGDITHIMVVTMAGDIHIIAHGTVMEDITAEYTIVDGMQIQMIIIMVREEQQGLMYTEVPIVEEELRQV